MTRRRYPLISAALAAALIAVYFGFQHGSVALGVTRTIDFRCNAVEYGLVPYEVTHPGARIWDPFCQPHGEEEPAGGGHDHPRSDPGLFADAPTWLTPFTATVMHGGLLHLGASLLALLIFGPRLERRLGPWRFVGLFAAGAAAGVAALVLAAPNLAIATIGSTSGAAAIVGAHVALWRRSRLTPFELPALAVAAGWVALHLAVADLDAAQPVAGTGGDIAYLAPAAGLLVGVLAGLRTQPRNAPEVHACPTSAPQS